MSLAPVIRCMTAAIALLAAAPLACGQNRQPAASLASDGADAAGTPTPECLFVPGTAIPRLVMGVCRPGDPPDFRDKGQLELWDTTSPAADAEPIAVRPLFVPLYVYEERGGAGTTWYRVGDAYAATGERGTKGVTGWVDGRWLHALTGRYAYHFHNPKRVPPGVQLYESRAAAYAALMAQQRKPPAPDAGQDVLVTENLKESDWDPLRAGTIPPFVELPDEPEAGAADPLTDTTLTFSPPLENRLVRLGAVCGGPVKAEKLQEKKKEAEARAGIEIVFVIDETLSMKPWFKEVAVFIEQNLAGEGDTTNVKVAVSWYSDQTAKDPGLPHDVEALKPLVGPGIDADKVQNAKKRIVNGVREHEVRTVRGDRNPRELVFQGLEAAIGAAGLTPGENAMVFVIGDAGDRSDAETLEAHCQRVAALVQQHNLQLAFIQVADPEKPDQQPDEAFLAQARAVKDKLPAGKRESVMIQAVKDQNLAMRIADIQASMRARREVLQREIAKFEARNRYTQPGPLMKQRIEADGLDIEQFDDLNIQYFAPAYGWLYHPQQPLAEPQLRQLVFMAKPEVDALMATLITITGQVKKDGTIDGDAAVKKFGEVLAANSGHTGVKKALDDAWNAMSEEERTFGAFLRDKVGLRARNALLFHRGAAKPGPATLQAAALLAEHKERLFRDRERSAPRAGLPPPVWHDAWKVLP